VVTTVLAAALLMLVPLPAPAAVDRVSAARTRLLGRGWQSRDEVRLHWFGVTNFIASFGGHVVLLDAWIITGGTKGYVPTSVDDLIAVRPEYIYVGHGHFDHVADLGPIAEATGAKVVGTREHCASARANARRPQAVRCIPILEAGTRQPFTGGNSQSVGGPAQGLTRFGAFGRPADGPPGVKVTVVNARHSAPRQPDPADFRVPQTPPSDPTPTTDHPPDLGSLMALFQHAGDPEGGSLVYRFDIGALSIAWHDSAGPISNTGEAGNADITSALRHLGPVDVQLGAAVGFNQFTNGLRDLGDYMAALQPKLFIPTHHDNWAPPATTQGRYYEPAILDEMARLPVATRPHLCMISDPENYRTVFRFKTGQWAGAGRVQPAGCYVSSR
jgi:L-ascorbate metabolism protein UlaG (beta-lactamase superfamily)